jgi:uncharacterized protein
MSVPSVSGPRGPEPEWPQPRPWGFWATTLWCVAAMAVTAAVVMATDDVVSIWWPPQSDLSPDNAARFSQRDTILLGAITASLFATLALAARSSGIGAKTYLGLVLPRRREVIIGLCGMALIDAAFVLANAVAGPFESSEWFDGVYQKAVATGSLTVLVMAAVVFAPLIEELLFRGFLLPGWSASRLGPIVAILLTSAIWTALHIQYDWPALAMVYCHGLLLGWLRLRSGSTVLTIFLHAAGNAVALLLAVLSEPSATATL